MKSIYKKLFGVIAGATLLVGASSAQAAQLTQSQIQAVIQLLQSFNADSATINSVGASLGGILVSSGPDPIACPVLSSNLYIGVTDRMTGGQVSQLQRFLGINPTGYFGSITRSHVAAFQQQFAVYPITGGVGPLTRGTIGRVCQGGPIPRGGFFDLYKPFSVSVGQTVTEFPKRQLTVQLVSVSDAGAQVTLGQNCIQGTQCFYYPTQTYAMKPGQEVTFQGYHVTLSAVSYQSAAFTVAGAQTVDVSFSGPPISGQAPLIVTFISMVLDSSQYIIDYGDGGNSGPLSPPNGGDATPTITAFHTYSTPGTYTATLSRYISCMYTTPRCMIATQNIGQVTITVTGDQTVGGITVTQPIVGQMFTRGQTMPIAWSANSNIPSTASVVLDLYSQSGAKVGTIAIPEVRMGSYSWGIPRFPQNYMCTLQFPNGLCGISISTGQYYLVATVSTDPFNMSNTAAILGTSQSGIFTINQQ